MNNFFDNVIAKKTLLYALFISIISGFNCSYNERIYKNKINEMYYGRIHRMGGKLYVAVNNIDTISQNVLVNFINCLESQESKNGSETRLIEIVDRFLYIDQLADKNLYVRVLFMPDTTMFAKKRKVILEYIKSKKVIEVEYKPSEFKCTIE